MLNLFKLKKRRPNKKYLADYLKDEQSIQKVNEQSELEKNIQKNDYIEDWEKELTKSKDYTKTFYFNQESGKKFHFTFLSSLVEEKVLDNNVLPALLTGEFCKIADVKKLLPIADVELSSNTADIPQKLLSGYVMLTIEGDTSKFAFISAYKQVARSVTAPEIEFSVVGPKEAFSEDRGVVALILYS